MAVAVSGLLVGVLPDLAARTRKGDRLLAEGRVAEQRKDWDKALSLYEQALAEDPGDVAYQIGVRRVRFQAAQTLVERGLRLRAEGKLEEALAAFQKAFATDPSSAIAEQELRVTGDMIEREKKKAAAGKESNPEERGMTPAAQERQEAMDRITSLRNVPELKPLSTQPINLRINNQPPKVLFETVCKLAGLNLILDPEYRSDPNAARNISLELSNATVEQALDYLAALTKSFWKPLSANTILVTNDNQVKRRDYEDMVLKVFYLTNLTTPQELTEISTMLRSITDIRRVHQYTAQNVLIVRGTQDQVLLAEKLINDLDKPKSEVVVDVLVMEANRTKTRDLASTIASGGSSGIDTNVMFTPHNPVLLGGTQSSSTTTAGDSTSTTTTPTQTPYYNPYMNPYGGYGGYGGYGYGAYGGTGTSTQPQLISLARIARISTNDFSITLPGALLQAVMTDRNTKVLQSPQVRAAHGQKASLRIGDKVPIASGGMQPFGGVVGGMSSLYSQFQFLDVGVNVDITPTVHGSNEVTLKVVLEISNVRDRIDLGGISQPVIGQRKVEHEIRIREGEVSLLGGLMQTQETRSLAGIPGLMNIPVLKRIFSSESVEKSDSELLIALIPHIVRSPGITDVNLRPVAAGTDAAVKVSMTPREAPSAAKEAKPQPVPAPAPQATPPQAPPAPATPPVERPVLQPPPPGSPAIPLPRPSDTMK
jgi:general secretion pathway protein D